MNIVHKSVLLSEVVEILTNNIKTNDLIIDGTLGRGGHFFALLKLFNKFLALDADACSVNYVRTRLIENGFVVNNNLLTKDKSSVLLLNDNFVNVVEILNANKLEPRALLLDLGISMYQIKESKRGFSFLGLGEDLDMRIDPVKNQVTAKGLLNGLSKKELAELFLSLGEEYQAKKYANLIVNYRKTKRIEKVGDLIKALKINSTLKYKIHPATKVFMALRIAVNSEHINLKQTLLSVSDLIKNGLLVLVITFHSLEEMTVKNYCKDNNFKFKKFYPTEEELKINNSARSAVLYFIKNDKK